MPAHILNTWGLVNGDTDTQLSLLTQNYGLGVENDRIFCHAYRTTNLSVASSGSYAKIPFQSVLNDPVSYYLPTMWKSGTPTLIGIPQSGLYLLTTSIIFAAVDTYDMFQGVRIGSTDRGVLGGQGLVFVANQRTHSLNASVVNFLVQGDTVYTEVRHSHTASVTLTAGVGTSSFMVQRLG